MTMADRFFRVWWCEVHGCSAWAGESTCQANINADSCRIKAKGLVAADALVIERVGGKWPEWITDVDGPVWSHCGGTDGLLDDIFDALAARESG